MDLCSCIAIMEGLQELGEYLRSAQECTKTLVLECNKTSGGEGQEYINPRSRYLHLPFLLCSRLSLPLYRSL